MSHTFTKSKLSVLRLVYPPISNQEAIWLESEEAAVEQFRRSDFYMIGGRAELKFTNFVTDLDRHVLNFGVKLGGSDPDPVQLHLTRLPCIANSKSDDYRLAIGDKVIKLIEGHSDDDSSQLLDLFTTERLLLECARGNPAIEGLRKLRDLATYDLLYAGIAKVGDSFERLMKRGHKARMDILANEPQRYPGARVTDEIFLFLFRVAELDITIFEANHDFSENNFVHPVENKKVVADAEKAFVSLLKPEYNVVQFNEYPKGLDGLYGSDYERYGYIIGETLAFNTAHGRIKGAHDSLGMISNEADFILVEGDKVSLFVSGVDFPAESL